jgi:hypothetical protein
MYLTLKHASPFRLALAGLLMNCQLGATQSDPDPNSGFGEKDRGLGEYGPWDLDHNLFSNLLNKQPNATGIYPLPVPNTTAPASDSTPVDGWVWKINVTVNIPISSSNSTKFDPGVQPTTLLVSR